MSKSKEQVIDELQKENPHSIPISKAMDEWAKITAIEYDDWKSERGYFFDSNDRQWYVTYSKIRLSHEELFNRFLQDKNIKA